MGLCASPNATATYQEALICLNPSDAPDLYAVHQRILKITDGNRDIHYIPVDQAATVQSQKNVWLRSRAGIRFPPQTRLRIRILRRQQRFTAYADVRLIRQTAIGERLPSEASTLARWSAIMEAGGLQAENMQITPKIVQFYYARLRQKTRFHYWRITSDFTVIDPEKAVDTLIKGVGRSKGLGFGRLIRIA